MQPVTLEDGTQLDPKILKVMGAIRHVESGGNYNAVGDGGQSHGAFQWNKDHFQKQATSFGLDPNDFSPGNQNKVAYKQIEAYKNQGLDPEEIAAVWNGAKRNPDTGKLTYVNPEYGRKFRTALQGGQQSQQAGSQYPVQSLQIPAGVSTNGQSQGATGQGSFIGDVGQTLGEAGTGVGNALQQSLSGQINPLSGLIQGTGAIAGGVGGLANNVLEHLPGVGGVVKGAEGLVGQGAQALAQTQPGQQVVQGVQRFSQAHPELAGDIGGAANIAAFAGGGIAGRAAEGAVENGVKSALSKGFQTAAEGGLGKTVAGIADKSATKTATRLLETNPTEKEVESAIKSGRLVDGKIAPDALKTSEINQVKGLIKRGKITRKMAPEEAAPVIQKAGQAESQSMRAAIKDSEIQPILQPEDLENLTTQVKKRAVESVVSGENPSDKLLKVFTDNLPKGQDITAEDVLNARQAVSDYILKNKGDWSRTGVLTGFKNARDAFTDESRKLLMKMAPGVDIGGSLNKQAALYRAAERMAPAVKKAITVKAKPRSLVKGLLKAGAHYTADSIGIGAISHLLNN